MKPLYLFWNKFLPIFAASYMESDMRKLLLTLLFCFLTLHHAPVQTVTSADKERFAAMGEMDGAALFHAMQLDGVVGFLAFRQAVEGYNKIEQKSKPILTLIDYTKPSTEKRLFVFDMEKRKLLYSSYVSHGRNSGENYATSFSNQEGSYKSSLGFYLTGGTYQGKNGYSMILDGLEKGVNDKARERAIVMHGAAYANPSVIASAGRLGRSLGCPALPQTVTQPIINMIKGGSVLFIYANNQEYMAKTSILPVTQNLSLLNK